MPSRRDTLKAGLDNYLQSRIPDCHLKRQPLPLVPELSLYLINEDYPRDRLEPEQAAALMDNPPYWAFCWGSGQALARWILDNPLSVKDRVLVDFGCGSGVAGIAAKMAGARRVILCDQDRDALSAGRLNASVNRVEVEFSASLKSAQAELNRSTPGTHTLVTVADVFYDRDNLPLLPHLQQNFASVLVADSRLRGKPLPGMDIFARLESATVPDLDESMEFNRITLYRSAVVPNR